MENLPDRISPYYSTNIDEAAFTFGGILCS